jgi:hypothetical protein
VTRIALGGPFLTGSGAGMRPTLTATLKSLRVYASSGVFKPKTKNRFMPQNSLKRIQYAAGFINLLGLMLSAGAWAFDVWLRTNISGSYLRSIWTLGVFCWILGLLLFIAAWVTEASPGGR